MASANSFFDDIRSHAEVIDPPESEEMMDIGESVSDPAQNSVKSNVTVSSSVRELLECPVCLNAMYPPIHQVGWLMPRFIFWSCQCMATFCHENGGKCFEVFLDSDLLWKMHMNLYLKNLWVRLLFLRKTTFPMQSDVVAISNISAEFWMLSFHVLSVFKWPHIVFGLQAPGP